VRFAIIGCGLVGRKRAAAVRGRHELVICADVDEARAAALAAEHPGCVATTDARRVIEHPTVDAVIVATTHDALATTTRLAVEAGKHVLVEKPAARRVAELRPVLEAARARRVVVKVGFNHRFHPALRQAHDIFARGDIGPLMYVRARYGHGGRPGYEKEWRAQPEVSGGGELLDQGSHLIDLARWFAGDFEHVSGHVDTFFWPMRVEDNAFMLLRSTHGVIAWLHASWTEWKNTFSFEVFGQTGKLQVDGLGGSYGPERLTFYRMPPEMGPPETKVWEMPSDDGSWAAETEHFFRCIEGREAPIGTLDDAAANLTIIECLYAEAGRDHHA
jgi:predicted dehydrogenase